jgi:hypothetical protein
VRCAEALHRSNAVSKFKRTPQIAHPALAPTAEHEKYALEGNNHYLRGAKKKRIAREFAAKYFSHTDGQKRKRF